MNCPKCGAPLAAGSGFCSGCGNQVATAGVPEKKGGGKVTCLIIGVVACVLAVPVIGIIAAIAIPNLLSGIQNGRQKRTMGDMKTVASALEQYNTDYGHYPVASNTDELCKALSPDYIVTCIRRDGWHSAQAPREFAYAAWGGTPEGCPAAPGSGAASAAEPPPGPEGGAAGACGPAHYGLASAGKDGKFSASDYSGYAPGDTDTFDADIVLMDGVFIRSPVGRQRNLQSNDLFDRPPAPAPEDFVPSKRP